MDGIATAPNSLFDFDPMAEAYENWYETDAGRANDWIQQRDVLKFLHPTHRAEKLLDVGCGTGHWSRFFYSLGYQVHGIDISEKMIFAARSSMELCTYSVADACALPFMNSSFDIVTAMASLEFISKPTVAIQEMIRCLRPGGCLLIGTLNRHAPINKTRKREREEPYLSGHLFSPAELWDLLFQYGKTLMLASILRENGIALQTHIVDKRPTKESSLDGAFIIAKVRR